jgi:hypothetical protein
MGMSSPQKNTVRFALIGLTLLAVGSLLVQELEDEAAPLVQAVPEPPKAEESSLSGSVAPTPATLATGGGITVQVDQRTGELLPPNLEQKRVLAQSLRDRFGKPPQAVFMRDRTLSLVVGTRLLNFSVARMNEKGELEVDCVSRVERAADLLERSPSPGDRAGQGVEE